MPKFQIDAYDAAGTLTHCGPHEFERFDWATAVRYVYDWEKWADGIAAAHPGCPTAASRRKTVRLFYREVGTYGVLQSFEVPSWVSLDLPLPEAIEAAAVEAMAIVRREYAPGDPTPAEAEEIHRAVTFYLKAGAVDAAAAAKLAAEEIWILAK